MSKIIPPVYGKKADQTISEIIFDLEREGTRKQDADKNRDYVSLVGEVSGFINPDVCTATDEGNAVYIEIRRLIGRYYQYLKDRKKLFNFRKLGFDFKTEALLVASRINTYRLECAHCLNSGCKYRDPDYPVQEEEDPS